VIVVWKIIIFKMFLLRLLVPSYRQHLAACMFFYVLINMRFPINGPKMRLCQLGH